MEEHLMIWIERSVLTCHRSCISFSTTAPEVLLRLGFASESVWRRLQTPRSGVSIHPVSVDHPSSSGSPPGIDGPILHQAGVIPAASAADTPDQHSVSRPRRGSAVEKKVEQSELRLPVQGEDKHFAGF